MEPTSFGGQKITTPLPRHGTQSPACSVLAAALAEVLGHLLFVVGGCSSVNTTFNVEHYNENTHQWHHADDMGIHCSAPGCCVVPGLSNIMEYIPRRCQC